MEKKKLGRPTESKKDFMLRTRLDEKTLEKLEYLSKEQKTSKSEIVRNGIDMQYQKLRK